MKRFIVGVAGAGFAVALATAPAQAVPNLQFYVEGATYCTTICPNSTLNPGGAGAFKDSWAISGTTGLRLWVVGDADIFDVHFVASYNHDVGFDINEPVPQFTLTPVMIGDPLTAAGIAAYVGPQNVGGYPFGGNADAVLDPNAPPTVYPSTFYPMDSALPVGNNENKYDPDRGWQVFYLGDMQTSESCAFNTKPGDSPFLSCGGNLSKTLQVNAYDITFPNPADVGQVVNFDAFYCEINAMNVDGNGKQSLVSNIVKKKGQPTEVQGCVSLANGKQAWNEPPNSHDAQWLQLGSVTVPEPATLGLLGLGLIGFAVARRRQAA